MSLTLLIMVLSFLVFLILGVPVGIALAAGVLTAILLDPNVSLGYEVILQQMYSGLESTALMAIPFFILAGNIMTSGGIARRLVDFTNSIVGSVRGGMGFALILAAAFFAALSGSAPATVVAVGVMLYPEMVRLGYNPRRVAGLLPVASGLGPVIPPSIVMIVTATLIGTSVSDMFRSGLLIGVVIAAALIVVVAFLARKENWPRDPEPFSFKRLLRTFVKALPALMVPGIILGGIYSGIFTPTESAAVAVVYALIISFTIYRETSLRGLGKIFLESAKGTAMILFIIAASTAFGWLFAYSGTSAQLVQIVASMDLSPVFFALVIAALLLILGIFIEGTALAILMVPILWPMAEVLGMHPVHFGMIISLAAVVGTMTPPVAVSLMATISVTKLRMGEIVKGQTPFFLVFLFVVLLVVVFPWFSTVLL